MEASRAENDEHLLTKFFKCFTVACAGVVIVYLIRKYYRHRRVGDFLIRRNSFSDERRGGAHIAMVPLSTANPAAIVFTDGTGGLVLEREGSVVIEEWDF